MSYVRAFDGCSCFVLFLSRGMFCNDQILRLKASLQTFLKVFPLVSSSLSSSASQSLLCGMPAIRDRGAGHPRSGELGVLPVGTPPAPGAPAALILQERPHSLLLHFHGPVHFHPVCAEPGGRHMVKEDGLSLSAVSLFCREVKVSECSREQEKPGAFCLRLRHHSSFMIFRK